MTELIAYLSTHGPTMLVIGSVALLLADLITSLTPTKSDDLWVERVAKKYRKLLEFLKVPNIKRKEGSIIVPDGTHRKKE